MSSREALHPQKADISAFLDGELETAQQASIKEHLATCPSCARDLEALGNVRRIVRTQPVGDVPDLVDAIVGRIAGENSGGARRQEWSIRLRIASTAAVAAAVLLFGASLPGGDDPPQVASAAQIAEKVRTEARSLRAFRASYSIVERGWDERVGTRRFSAEILFDSPESYRLTIADDTSYPSDVWPTNDVKLVAGARSWWIREPTSCPPKSLPTCAGAGSRIEERAHVAREPFDGTIGLPGDLILPLKTLADSPTFSIQGREEIAGRSTVRISLPFRQTVPLVSALQEGGLWRSFYPSDPTEVWIDEATGFPMRFRVRADDSADRRVWAERLGYGDGPGQILLVVSANDFSEPTVFPPDTFSTPKTDLTSSGRFQRMPFSEVPGSFVPEDVAGLDALRAGSSGDRTIVSYAKGMAWLKVVASPVGRSPATANPRSEEIRLSNGAWAYYLPATSEQGRSIEMFGDEAHLRVDTNLPRATARRVAASIAFDARRLTGNDVQRSDFAQTRVAPEDLEDIAAYRSPAYLPPGYTVRAAYTSRRTSGMSVTTYYGGPESEFDGLGIRITQERGVDLLPPAPEEGVRLRFGDLVVRWFPERGEIDWIANGSYTSISAPSFSRSVTLRIAQSLR